MPDGSYDADAIIAKFTAEPIRMAVLTALAMGFGFVQYLFSAYMARADRRSPFPVYMHAYYLAHDFLYATLFRQWFAEYRSPVFQAIWFGMVTFNVLELHALWGAVRDERQAAFGRFYDGPVTVRQAIGWVSVLTVGSFVLLTTARSFLDDRLMFCLFISTNVMMAIGPALAASERRVRTPGALGLSVAILLGTVATFLPRGLGLYTTADPAYFSRPAFFVLGAFCVVVAVWHVALIARLPVRALADTRVADRP